MADTNMFLFSTVAQVNYFAQVGRLIAEKNNKSSKSPKSIKSTGEQNDNAVCVIIKESYGQNVDIITSVRRAWMMNKQRVSNKQIEYVLAIFNNTIIGVYEFADKNRIVESYEPERVELNIKLASLEMQNKWLGIRVKDTKGGEIHYTYIETK